MNTITSDKICLSLKKKKKKKREREKWTCMAVFLKQERRLVLNSTTQVLNGETLYRRTFSR